MYGKNLFRGFSTNVRPLKEAFKLRCSCKVLTQVSMKPVNLPIFF